jgi:hypothetical protein
VTIGGWKYAAASVIGTSHQKLPGGVCQDSHAVRYLERASVLAAVVSDGAGSASQAHIGSRLTCDLIASEIAGAAEDKLFAQSFACDTLARVQAMLGEEADRSGLAIRDFACTMLVAIAAPQVTAFWQIGDGAMCFRGDGTEKYHYAYWPEKGDYANVTYFVTDTKAQDELQFDTVEGEAVELALFSDGIERLALDFVAGEVHTGFFNGLFPHMRALSDGFSLDLSKRIEEFLGSERVNKRTDDDKTLILASRIL